MNRRAIRTMLLVALGLSLGASSAALAAGPVPRESKPVDLWDLARGKQKVHRFSTLITA